MSLSSNSPKQLGTFFQSVWPTPLVCSLHTRLCTISKIFMKIWISIFHHIHWLQLHLGWHQQSHPLVPFPNYFSQLFPSLEQGTCRWSWTDKVSLHSKSDTEVDPKALLASSSSTPRSHPRVEPLCHPPIWNQNKNYYLVKYYLNLLESTISQKQPSSFSFDSQVKICKLDISHY